MTTWLLDVEVDGSRVDVAASDGVIKEVRPAGEGRPGRADDVLQGRGGWLLPGLHDHHIHLMSLAATLSSVDCSPVAAPNLEALGRLLRADTHPDGWVRGVGHHDAATGPLDRHVLDGLVPDRPVRIQHRGGALWVLNSLALQRVAQFLDDSADVERDEHGHPTGRLWRYDTRLAPGLPRRQPDLARLGNELRSMGITSVTDATPEVHADTAGLLAAAVSDGRLPLDVTVLGAGPTVPDPLRAGPAKVMLRDHDLPDLDQLVATLARHRADHRAVAVHCVTVESLVLTLAALDEVGVVVGDRIEHAAVLPRVLLGEIRKRGLRVVMQPDFLRTRGAEYLAEVDPRDLPDLVPYRRLLDAGIAATCASDAPFGDPDPWQVIASASRRRTHDGRVIGADETVSTATALAGYLSPAADPGGRARRVALGAAADLLLLEVGSADALEAPDRVLVRGTLRAGAWHPGWAAH